MITLTQTDLPSHGKKLTEKVRNELFVWCGNEYKRRFNRDWRFKNGELTRTDDGEFRLHYVSNNTYAIGTYVTCKNRYWLENLLLHILNDALDEQMTLG